MERAEERYTVNFPVHLNWQDDNGLLRRTTGRCVDLSESGLLVITMDRLEPQTTVVVANETLGRLGHACVRYCQRFKMKNHLGLSFTSPFRLGDPARRKAIEQMIEAGQG